MTKLVKKPESFVQESLRLEIAKHVADQVS
jgi:hypothetical protein